MRRARAQSGGRELARALWAPRTVIAARAAESSTTQMRPSAPDGFPASTAVLVGGTVPRGPPSWAAGRGAGAFGLGFEGGRWVGAGFDGGRGVGLGVGASAWGGSSPTIALGWMLRSWFLLPAQSSWSVRICHGAPDTSEAPSRAPPPAVSQYRDWARWPPHARRTADPVERKRTRMSAVLLPLTLPAWAGRLIDVMVPPQIVRRRGEPE